MSDELDDDLLPLPKGWAESVRSAVLNIVGLVRIATLAARAFLIEEGDGPTTTRSAARHPTRSTFHDPRLTNGHASNHGHVGHVVRRARPLADIEGSPGDSASRPPLCDSREGGRISFTHLFLLEVGQ